MTGFLSDHTGNDRLPEFLRDLLTSKNVLELPITGFLSGNQLAHLWLLFVSLEDVCAELKKYGVEINADMLRNTYPEEEQLARVERNLWQMLRRIEEENRSGMSA